MRSVKKIIKEALCLCGRIYYRLRAKRAVWKFINTEAISLYRRESIKLDAASKRVVKELKEQGIAVAHINEFFPSKVFEELHAFAEHRWGESDVREQVDSRLSKPPEELARSKNFYLIDLWRYSVNSPGEFVLDIRNPFTRFSLSEEVLRIAASYLEMFPKFRYWHLETTMPMPAQNRAFASQVWHRDPDDQQLMKAFLYLNDVDEEAGPFTYLKYSQYGGKWRHLFPQNPPSGTQKMPPNVDDLIPKEDRHTGVGRAGTIIFADTSGLHRGGFAKGKNRFMYTSAYAPPSTLLPIRYKYPAGFDTSQLFSMQRYALENDAHQREPKYF